MHPIFFAHLIIYFGVLNLDIITFTPPLECSCFNLYLKQISFLYIRTLHNDCSHIEAVQLRRRSRAEFGLVSIMWLASSGDVGYCRKLSFFNPLWTGNP